MQYENWLGQILDAGVLVYNGQRDGNSSTMRVGRIKKIKTTPAGNTVAQVEWLYEQGGVWKIGTYESGAVIPWTKASSINPDNLVSIDPNILNTLKVVVRD